MRGSLRLLRMTICRSGEVHTSEVICSGRSFPIWPAGMVRVVRVPDPRSLHFYHVSGEYWPEDSPANWMGRQVNIVTHGQPIELSITGQYRPVELGPVEIDATVNGSEVASYRIGQRDTQVLSVPANASVTLRASATFVPNGLPRDGIQRRVSVLLSLQPESGSELAK